METKMITIPFEVEKAKKIQAGELPGKIVTTKGRDVKIIYWERKTESKHKIVGLVCLDTYERVLCFTEEGSSETDEVADIILQVPEWTQFKDGDILATKTGSCFILNANGEFKTSCYAGLFGKLSFGGAALEDCIEVMTYATDEEKQQFIDALKQSTDPRAKEYLKRFFGIEKKPECGFEFLQPVLVRAHPSYQWLYGNFTHISGELHFVSGGIGYEYCIPYNEQTKHLLGTTDDWETQP